MLVAAKTKDMLMKQSSNSRSTIIILILSQAEGELYAAISFTVLSFRFLLLYRVYILRPCIVMSTFSACNETSTVKF